MSYRYRREDLRSSNTVDANKFNKNLDSQVENLQALSRDQLPHDSIQKSMIQNGSLHLLTAAQSNTEISAPYRDNSPATGVFPSWACAPGMTYQNYSGDRVVAFTETVETKGGLIQVEFSCWVWRNTKNDVQFISSGPRGEKAAKAFRMRLLVDGLEIDSTANVYVPWMNIHLCGQTVALEGSMQVQVEWSMDPGRTYDSGVVEDDQELVMLFFGGSSLLMTQRRA